MFAMQRTRNVRNGSFAKGNRFLTASKCRRREQIMCEATRSVEDGARHGSDLRTKTTGSPSVRSISLRNDALMARYRAALS